MAINWFDEEIRDVFGIYVSANPFPLRNGYQFFRKDRVSLLLIRVEHVDPCYAKAFSDFFTIEAPQLRKLHITDRGASKQIYRSFLRSVSLPATLLDDMYDSCFARHFYSQKEIVEMRRKW